MQPTLLVLAAGMGSRYGGLKQLDPVGPSEQTILDYSVFDAIRAGFGKVVFVIRKDFADEFKERISSRFEGKVAIEYAFQSLEDLPDGFALPEGRTKPWGTAHAVLAARNVIHEPFAVINADDFYGSESYQQMADYLKELPEDKLGMGMIGYHLDKTVSLHGSVNRGICTVENGSLKGIQEVTGIVRDAEGTLTGLAPDNNTMMVAADSIVSMNFWGFNVLFLHHVEAAFTEFLRWYGNEEKSECYLPSVVDGLIVGGVAECPVLPTRSHWFGVTYPHDKPSVIQQLDNLTRAGHYPVEF